MDEEAVNAELEPLGTAVMANNDMARIIIGKIRRWCVWIIRFIDCRSSSDTDWLFIRRSRN